MTAVQPLVITTHAGEQAVRAYRHGAPTDAAVHLGLLEAPDGRIAVSLIGTGAELRALLAAALEGLVLAEQAPDGEPVHVVRHSAGYRNGPTVVDVPLPDLLDGDERTL